jgi:hypothetical protein
MPVMGIAKSQNSSVPSPPSGAMPNSLSIKSMRIFSKLETISCNSHCCSARPSHLERKFVTLYDSSNRYRGERLWRMQV